MPPDPPPPNTLESGPPPPIFSGFNRPRSTCTASVWPMPAHRTELNHQAENRRPGTCSPGRGGVGLPTHPTPADLPSHPTAAGEGAAHWQQRQRGEAGGDALPARCGEGGGGGGGGAGRGDGGFPEGVFVSFVCCLCASPTVFFRTSVQTVFLFGLKFQKKEPGRNQRNKISIYLSVFFLAETGKFFRIFFRTCQILPHW